MGVDQVDIDPPGMAEGISKCLLGDLMENYPLQLHIIQLRSLNQMPGDGLTLTIRVGGEIYGRGLLGRLPYLLHHRPLLLGNYVLGGETFFHIHSQSAPGQITNMSNASLDTIAVSQHPAHRFCLGRRLDNDQTLAHRSITPPGFDIPLSSPGRGYNSCLQPALLPPLAPSWPVCCSL